MHQPRVSPHPINPPWRISVVGNSGSGKTTLARRLGQRLGIPHVEIDALFWGPNWTSLETEAFRDRISQVVAADSWVMDGNYLRTRDLVWQRATLIVWLDYPHWVVMRQIIPRTVGRVLLQKELWSGNREHWRDAFFSKDSMIYYAWHTHHKRHLEYAWLLGQPEFEGRVVQLRSRRQMRQWLDSLPIADTSSAGCPE